MKNKLITLLIAVLVMVVGVSLWLWLTPYSGKVKSKSYDVMLQKLLKHSVEEISVKDLANSKQEYIYLDSRDEKEFATSHLKNARFVGFSKDSFNEDAVKDLPEDTPIVVYCSVGFRSEKTTEQLRSLGFSNVKNLYGGLFEWSNNELPMVDNNNNRTTKIHAYNKKWGAWINKGEKVY